MSVGRGNTFKEVQKKNPFNFFEMFNQSFGDIYKIAMGMNLRNETLLSQSKILNHQIGGVKIFQDSYTPSPGSGFAPFQDFQDLKRPLNARVELSKEAIANMKNGVKGFSLKEIKSIVGSEYGSFDFKSILQTTDSGLKYNGSGGLREAANLNARDYHQFITGHHTKYDWMFDAPSGVDEIEWENTIADAYDEYGIKGVKNYAKVVKDLGPTKLAELTEKGVLTRNSNGKWKIQVTDSNGTPTGRYKTILRPSNVDDAVDKYWSSSGANGGVDADLHGNEEAYSAKDTDSAVTREDVMNTWNENKNFADKVRQDFGQGDSLFQERTGYSYDQFTHLLNNAKADKSFGKIKTASGKDLLSADERYDQWLESNLKYGYGNVIDMNKLNKLQRWKISHDNPLWKAASESKKERVLKRLYNKTTRKDKKAEFEQEYKQDLDEMVGEGTSQTEVGVTAEGPENKALMNEFGVTDADLELDAELKAQEKANVDANNQKDTTNTTDTDKGTTDANTETTTDATTTSDTAAQEAAKTSFDGGGDGGGGGDAMTWLNAASSIAEILIQSQDKYVYPNNDIAWDALFETDKRIT